LKTPFAGFPEEGVAFLRALKKHNRREWFQPRKELFAEQVLRPMVALVEAIQRGLLALAPDYAHGDPRKAVYRIYRDTRFSADKTPYKTHIAASLTRAGLDKGSSPGIYFSVGPDEVEVGGGWYLPLPPQVLAVRNAIAAEPDRFRRIVEARELTRRFGGLQGARLTRSPRGGLPQVQAVLCVHHAGCESGGHAQVICRVDGAHPDDAAAGGLPQRGGGRRTSVKAAEAEGPARTAGPNRGRSIPEMRAAGSSGWDDAVCAAPWLRSGGSVPA
jgi:uncharacterized protein (TIGR02453 family)